MPFIGIVGAEAAKFTNRGEQEARRLIIRLLTDFKTASKFITFGGMRLLAPPVVITLVSGGCHLGGIDIWAEEEAEMVGGYEKRIHLPKERRWSTGYKLRDALIARDADVVHNIVVLRYPPAFDGQRFVTCYHCARRTRERPDEPAHPWHVKSGGCWTAMEAERLRKPVFWHFIRNED